MYSEKGYKILKHINITMSNSLDRGFGSFQRATVPLRTPWLTLSSGMNGISMLKTLVIAVYCLYPSLARGALKMGQNHLNGFGDSKTLTLSKHQRGPAL
jgi:hypothetical protein